jgi:Fe2+ or Zn2+ uptake regulation protein
VSELDAPNVFSELKAAAAAQGFSDKHAMIEVSGLCAACKVAA